MIGKISEIPLTQDQFAVVDLEDFEYLNQWKWHAQLDQSTGSFYAVRGLHKIRMHRQLLGLEHGDKQQIDHINRDTLDNRRSNLRIVTNRENSENRKDQSQYGAGVQLSRQCSSERYQAQAIVNGVKRHIGMYATPKEAQTARKQFLKEN